MRQKLGPVTMLVEDYDDAIDFYTRKLRFRLVDGNKWDLLQLI